MGKYDRHNHSPGDIMRRQRNSEQTARANQTARRLPNSSYREPGEIRFLDVDANERFALGRRSDGMPGDVRFGYRRPGKTGFDVIVGAQLRDGIPSSHGYTGFYLDGTQLFRLADPVDESESPFFVQFRNGAFAFALAEGARPVINTPGGTSIVWLDDEGLRRPLISQQWTDGWFGDSVDGSSFESVAEGWVTTTYSQARLQYRLVRTGTPTVEVRLRDMVDDATIAGPVQHSESGRFTFDFVPGGTLNSSRRYELQARIVSGSTSARFGVTRCVVGLVPGFSP